MSRVEIFCTKLDLASERGTLRNDVRNGLCIVGFERRLTIAFTVDDERLTNLKVFAAGQNWEAADW